MQAWQGPSQRTIGMKPIGPVAGVHVLQEGWDLSTIRFAKALVRNAVLEKMAVFGPSWDGSIAAWNALHNGVTALSCNFL